MIAARPAVGPASGAWPSPFGPADAAAGGGEPRWLAQQWVLSAGETVWWTDPRPAEKGRDFYAEHLGAPGQIHPRVHASGGTRS